MTIERVRLHDHIVDLEAAQRFLDLLGAKHTTFQNYDDNAEREDRTLACILHGTLADHADELQRLNRKGAGIFVAVNRTDMRGRKKENIKSVRAVTADLDGVPLDPVLDCALKPHIVVESSPNRHHVYWRVKKLPLDQFEDVQRSIARKFDSDPSVALLTHVARLPGFYHRKAEPFLTRIMDADEDPAPYSADKIIAEFPPLSSPHRSTGSPMGRQVLSPAAPVESAGHFVEKKFKRDGVQCLHYYRGSFYEWTGDHYVECDADNLRSLLYGFLHHAVKPNASGEGYGPFQPTQSKVNGVLDALKAFVGLDSRRQPPFWLPPLAHMPNDLMACRNGLLDVTGLSGPDGPRLLPHDPHYFNVNSLPFDYDATAPAYPERWMQFLLQLWPGDGDGKRARLVLQEIFGLMLTPETRYQKIFMIVGPKRSGKGTIARVLTAMLGRDNVATPTLSGLSTNFGPSPLIDKRAAIISDARLGSRTDAHTVAERLLSISGEDALTIDRKYQEHWSGQLSVRFLILSNELPRIADASGALASRFVVVMLENSFYGHEDHSLTNKLIAELPGILNWSLAGLKRLRERGRFKMPDSSLDAIRQLEDLGSPVAAFLRDWCEVGPLCEIETKEFYAAYAHWCEPEGHRPGSRSVFGRDLKAACPLLRSQQRRRHGGGEIDRFYIGVGLSEVGREQYETAMRSSLRRRSG